MSRVAFVQMDYLPSLGVGLLSSLLRREGHTAATLFVRDRDFPMQFHEFSPDIVALSLTSGQMASALNLAAWVKQKRRDIRIVVGGAHPTFVPEIAAHPHIDFVVRGEGETALLALCKALDDGYGYFNGIPNLVWQNGGDKLHYEPIADPIADLDSLPHPNWAPYFARPHLARFYRRGYSMLAGRGCPYKCSYCHNKQLHDLYDHRALVRKRSVASIMDEIRLVKNKYGVTGLRFEDDTFVLDKQHLEDFVQANAKDGLPFSCLTVAGSITDTTARLLAEGGCHLVCMGVETGDRDLRYRVLNKKVTDETIADSVNTLHKYGIKVETYNMMGLPGETLESAMKTLRLNRAIEADFAWCSIFQPYPGTTIFDELRAAGKLDMEKTEFPVSYFCRSVMDGPEIRQIVALQALMQYFVRFRTPEKLVRMLISPGENILFRAAFFGSYMFEQIRTKKLSLFNAMHIAFISRPRIWKRRDPNCIFEKLRHRAVTTMGRVFPFLRQRRTRKAFA